MNRKNVIRKILKIIQKDFYINNHRLYDKYKTLTYKQLDDTLTNDDLIGLLYNLVIHL